MIYLGKNKNNIVKCFNLCFGVHKQALKSTKSYIFFSPVILVNCGSLFILYDILSSYISYIHEACWAFVFHFYLDFLFWIAQIKFYLC